jgi:REP element-mobilizing transposase RayT
MPNSYSQIYIQIIFAVQGRQNLIPRQYKEELHKFITGIIQNRKQKMLALHSMPDHSPIFIGLNPSSSICDLVSVIKAISSKFFIELVYDEKYLLDWIGGIRFYKQIAHMELKTHLRYLYG